MFLRRLFYTINTGAGAYSQYVGTPAGKVGYAVGSTNKIIQ